MNFAPGWAPGFTHHKQAFSASFVSAPSTGNNQTAYNFTGTSIGAVPGPNDRRWIAVAAIAGSSGAGVASLTIAGIVATKIIEADFGTISPCAIFIAEVPASVGTTADILVTFGGAAEGAALGVARLLNVTNPMGDDTAVQDGASATLDLSVNIRPGGFALACTGSQNASATTWTGLTEQLDADLATGEVASVASGGSPGTPHTITAQNSDGSPSRYKGVCASWS